MQHKDVEGAKPANSHARAERSKTLRVFPFVVVVSVGIS